MDKTSTTKSLIKQHASTEGKLSSEELQTTFQPAIIPDRPFPMPVIVFLVVVGMLAFIDRYLMLNTLLLECVHALVVTAILLSCIVFERRHPHIRQFGWPSIVLGIGLLALGAYIDIIDDPPLTMGAFGRSPFPFGPSWEKEVLKKTVGYSFGIGLFAYGFFQWIPWMLRTRLDMLKLNNRLSVTNRNLNRALMSMDEHIESNRVAISRELHDDVAQQLTFVNVQIQLCRKEMNTIREALTEPIPTETSDTQTPGEDAAGLSDSNYSERKPEKSNECRLALITSDTAKEQGLRIANTDEQLEKIASSVSEALRSVRQISGDLRPESLFSLGLIPALEQFFEKLYHQYPETQVLLTFEPLVDNATHTHFEKHAKDAALLHLFRIIQEGVRNAIKHGNATEIDVLLQEVPTPRPRSRRRNTSNASDTVSLRIVIADNGKGLPWPVIPSDDQLIQEGHLGIVGLKERTKELGGTFSLNSRDPEAGASLEIILR